MDVHLANISYVPILKDNYIWLILDSHQRKVIAIDPGDAYPLQIFLNAHQLHLEAILITHHHFDHTQGILPLKETYQCSVYGPYNQDIPGITHPVREPDTIHFPFIQSPISILNIPGHTLDHIAYLLPGILFCGDTLFSAGCGRVFEGTIEQMYQSLQKIAGLPDDTKVYCAHEYTLQNLSFAQMVEPFNTKIQDAIDRAHAFRDANIPTLPVLIRDEKEINPFLRCHVKEVIESVEKNAGKKLKNTIEVFRYLRQWKNCF